MPRIIKKEDIQNHPQIPGFQIKSVTETLNQDSKVMEVKQLILDPNIISPEFTHNGYDQLLYVIKGDGIAGIIYRSKNNLIDIPLPVIIRDPLQLMKMERLRITFLKIKIKNLQDMIHAANILLKLGAKNVLVKGGHRNTKRMEDVLLSKKKIKILILNYYLHQSHQILLMKKKFFHPPEQYL